MLGTKFWCHGPHGICRLLWCKHSWLMIPWLPRLSGVHIFKFCKEGINSDLFLTFDSVPFQPWPMDQSNQSGSWSEILVSINVCLLKIENSVVLRMEWFLLFDTMCQSGKTKVLVKESVFLTLYLFSSLQMSTTPNLPLRRSRHYTLFWRDHTVRGKRWTSTNKTETIGWVCDLPLVWTEAIFSGELYQPQPKVCLNVNMN